MDNNLNLYHIFFTVATCKNISAAAKELYISQPAISKAISKLEQNLDTKLFVRNSRGVSLTTEGELLFEQVQLAFSFIKNGEEKVRLANELGIGHLSIGVSTTLCKYVLLPYLQEFTQNNPHIQISISCQSSTETLEALQNGKVDIGLIGYPDSKNNLEYYPVMDIHDVFVTTQNYIDNFKKRGVLNKTSIMDNATFMLLNKENITRKYIDTHLFSKKMEFKNVIDVSNMDLLIDFAKIDLGIACVIKEFITDELKNQQLKELKLFSGVPARKIGFACLPQIKKENPSAKIFLENIAKKETGLI